jgi:hypothetical protein
MSILGVAIVPPHPTVLSLRMAVALYVRGISTPEVHPEFPPLLGTLPLGSVAHSFRMRVVLSSKAPHPDFHQP